MPRRIIAVRGGSWGLMTEEETALVTERLLTDLRRHPKVVSGAAVLETASSPEEALALLRKEETPTTVVFFSRGMQEAAATLKLGAPDARVVVLTGLDVAVSRGGVETIHKLDPNRDEKILADDPA